MAKHPRQHRSIVVWLSSKSWPPSVSQHGHSSFRCHLQTEQHPENKRPFPPGYFCCEREPFQKTPSRRVLHLSGQNCVTSQNLKPSLRSFGEWGHHGCLRLFRSYPLGKGSNLSRVHGLMVER